MEDLGLSFDGIWKGRRVWITGDTGFKGSWLALWLDLLGAEVHGFALPPPTRPSHWEAARLAGRVRHRDGDLRDAAAVQAAVQAARPEAVFHLAAQPLVRESYRDPRGTFETNVGGTVNVLEALRGCSSLRALVVVTSDKCYLNREWEFAYRENDPLGGRDPYSASKACAEHVVEAYRNSFFAPPGAAAPVGVASVRAGNVIGGGDWAPDRLIPDCVRALTAGLPVPIRNPRAVRPWQLVLEPLAGYLLTAARLLHDPLRFAGAYNFGPAGHDAVPVLDLAREFLAVWGDGTLAVEPPDPAAPHEAHLLRLSSERAGAVLGFHPVLEVREALRWTADWYRRWRDAAGGDLHPTGRAQIAAYTARARAAGAPWAPPG